MCLATKWQSRGVAECSQAEEMVSKNIRSDSALLAPDLEYESSCSRQAGLKSAPSTPCGINSRMRFRPFPGPQGRRCSCALMDVENAIEAKSEIVMVRMGNPVLTDNIFSPYIMARMGIGTLCQDVIFLCTICESY